MSLYRYISLIFILGSFVRASEQIDAIDGHCIDLSLAAFQAHQQYLNEGEPSDFTIDFTQPSIYDGCLLNTIPVKINRYTSDGYFDGWSRFLPIYGKTGLEHSWFGDNRKSTLLGMVGYNPQDNLLVLSFRGTREIQDWWNNADIGRKRPTHMDDEVLLHKGYLDIAESSLLSLGRTLDLLLTDIQADVQDNMHVAITGHSLGGSIAAASVPFMRQRFPSQTMSLRMFGSPKVGGQDYNDWLNLQTIITKSFVRQTDLSPSNPSGYGLMSLGTEISLPHYGDAWWFWPKAHDDRKYRRGIYEILNKPYDTGPSYDIIVTLWGSEYRI